jgi:hypothetical protein
MRESRTYGSVRGACDETHVPTATTSPPKAISASRCVRWRASGRIAGRECASLSNAACAHHRPDGAPDIVARLLGPWLSERLSQGFVAENRPGG